MKIEGQILSRPNFFWGRFWGNLASRFDPRFDPNFWVDFEIELGSEFFGGREILSQEDFEMKVVRF